jgi:hypothetical protein
MFGPNNVGSEPRIPMYHAGADTINFETNKMFGKNMIGNVGSVQAVPTVTNAWLTNSAGVGGFGNSSGSKFGGSSKFGSRRFGSNAGTPQNMVYTYNGPTSGRNTLSQPQFQPNKFGGQVITLAPNGSINVS